MESRLKNKAVFLEWANQQAAEGSDDIKMFFHFALDTFIHHSEAEVVFVSMEQYEEFKKYIARDNRHFKSAWDVVAPAVDELPRL